MWSCLKRVIYLKTRDLVLLLTLGIGKVLLKDWWKLTVKPQESTLLLTEGCGYAQDASSLWVSRALYWRDLLEKYRLINHPFNKSELCWHIFRTHRACSPEERTVKGEITKTIFWKCATFFQIVLKSYCLVAHEEYIHVDGSHWVKEVYKDS